MRLLKINVDGSFSLISFDGRRIPCYAILSHTWDDEEVTYQDLIAGIGSSKIGYKKLQFCRQQAQQDGLQYFWADSCCIDKTSSAEVSKAINSMFRWYRYSARCYVYLADVSKGIPTSRLPPSFMHSRWFTRGWTLQELLAPVLVELFSCEGVFIGTRESLEPEIHQITNITTQALRGDSLSQFNIEDRMAWAAKRETTLEEDQAYCLMGIFDICLPVIYGEGKTKAFRRLQEEINKYSYDNKQPSRGSYSTAQLQ